MAQIELLIEVSINSPAKGAKRMKVKKIRLALLFFVFALILVTGCNKEEEKEEPYSTVSNMIAERNKARFSRAAQDSSSKRAVGNEPVLSDEIPPAAQSERAKLPGITIEENIKIVSERSGKTIGTGIAYLDKSGKIITIRVKNSR